MNVAEDSISDESAESAKPPVEFKQETIESLKQKKLLLEIERMEDRSWFTWTISVGDLIPVFITVLTLFVAYATGLLDAKRLELAAEKSRFETEAMLSEAKAKETRKLVESLQKSLQLLQAKSSRHEKILQLVSRSRELSSTSLSIDLIEEPSRVSFTYANQSGDGLREILRGLSDLGDLSVEQIEISNVRLSVVEFALIARLRPRVLVLNDNKLSPTDSAGMQALAYEELRSLTLKGQHFTDLLWAREIPNLTYLQVFDVPLEDDCFEPAFAFNVSLKTLQTAGFEFNDSHLRGSEQFRNLNLVFAKDSSFSAKVMLRFLNSIPSCSVVGSINDLNYSTPEGRELVELVRNSERESSDGRKLFLKAPHPDSDNNSQVLLSDFPDLQRKSGAGATETAPNPVQN